MTTRDHARAFMPYPDAAVAHAAAGPLAGLSFGVKDLFDVAGYPTSGGQPFVLAMSGIKTETAPTVQRLLDAGARFAGKTITDELAFSMNGQNAHFGSPRQRRRARPHQRRLVVGLGRRRCRTGSATSPSAATPAARCARRRTTAASSASGRRTAGSASKGVMDLAPSLDTCGWFARDVPTFARVADVLLGADPAPLPAERVRLLAPTDVWGLLAPEVLRGAGRAARRGSRPCSARPRRSRSCSTSFDTMYWSFRYMQGREAWRTDGALIERFAPPLGPGVKERFAWAREVTRRAVRRSRRRSARASARTSRRCSAATACC